MIPKHDSLTELELLLELLCEDRLTPDGALKLEQLILSSPEARWKYLTYLDLHGTLYWDAAGAGNSEALSSQPKPISLAASETTPQPATKRAFHRYAPHIAVTVSAVALLLTVGFWQDSRPTKPPVIANHELNSDEVIGVTGMKATRRAAQRTYGPPVALAESDTTPPDVSRIVPQPVADVAMPPLPPISSQEVVARINEELQSRWTALEIHPSAKADDSEWLRRVYLDLIGRIPTATEAADFLADQQSQKRADLIERLLSDSGYVRNFTTKWTNLLIGRSSNPQVDRESFQKFLRLSFAANHPWNQMVADLVGAEGNNAENGAANFLIAHLGNDATPATAVASKLFLGRQVQCNQCHNNPFNDSKQLEYWEMNSFFQQTTTVSRQRRDPRTGKMAYLYTELVTQDAGGPTYFETQLGLMRVAYPRYQGHEVDPSPDINRRRELAHLMTDGAQPQLAAAFVNRMWEHFFGSGFTRNVDDMGSHQPASHPELLAALSDQFIRTGYDIKQLIRWICNSDAYQLSSRFSDSNLNDDPSMGELPSFSRMYVRSMTAEQTYDSFLTATKANQVGAVDWTQAELNRQQWLQPFVISYQTDENDETMTFEGTIGNALSLMNGPLIDKALDLSAGSFLGEIVRQKSSETDKIRSLYLAAFARRPEPGELSAMRKLVRASPSRRNANEAFQDLFWALLNSNEFVLVR